MKKNLMKLIFPATILMGIALTGCGGGEEGGADGAVRINFSYFENYTSKRAWTDLINAYNNGQGKEDKVFVVAKKSGGETPAASNFIKGKDYAHNVIAVSDTQNSFQTLAISRDSNKAPNGYFLDLTPYAEVDADFQANTINPETLNWFKMTYNPNAKQGAGQEKHTIGAGQNLIGVPYGTAQQYNWYNKKAFEDSGINIVSIYEEKLDEYNAANHSSIKPHGYAEYLEAPFTGAVSSKNSAGETVYKVFNNCIGMNWEEQRILFRYFTKDYTPTSPTTYGFVSEYWFNYGWSTGGDVMGYNGNAYDFTLMDKGANYIATKDVTVGGSAYKAGQVIRYEDKVNEANIETKDGVYAIKSSYDALKEYLSLQVGKATKVDGDDYGYGIASPDTDNMLNMFTTQQVAMVRRNDSWTFGEIASSANGENFDVCVPEQYREYEGGSTYNTSSGFNNEHLKVIGKEYDGSVYTGDIKKVNGTPITGRKTVAGNTNALVIPACSDPNKYQAAWDFISWVATEGQQYIAYTGTHSPVARDVLFSDKYAENAELSRGKNMKALALTASEVGRGDWGYFENGAWVTSWANDFNNNVRKGRKTMTQFLNDNATRAANDLNNMYCVIKGIR